MDKWRVTFTKKVEFELTAESETEALVEAMKLNLESMPVEWEIGEPVKLSDTLMIPEPEVSTSIELDSFGRPLYEFEEDEEE